MKQIQSKDNLVVRQGMKVAAGRDKTRILLEGVHLCEEWLKRYGPPESVLVQGSAVDHPDIARLLAANEAARQYLLADALFNAIATVQTPQGIMFVATRPIPAAITRLATTALWLDRLQDPGNLGTILRTAAAAGVRDVLLSVGCVGAWSPKVLRSAQAPILRWRFTSTSTFPTSGPGWICRFWRLRLGPARAACIAAFCQRIACGSLAMKGRASIRIFWPMPISAFLSRRVTPWNRSTPRLRQPSCYSSNDAAYAGLINPLPAGAHCQTSIGCR